MMSQPRILVIDDLYGRTPQQGRNQDRYDFCYRLKLVDVTGDEAGHGEPQKIEKPVAEAVFCRGQVEEGGVVRNDAEQVLGVIRDGWKSIPVWALVLLDLHFKTGPVGPDGEPGGTDQERDPSNYFGLQLLQRIKSEYSDLPVIVLSAMERDPIEAELSRRLAHEFRDRNRLTSQGLADLLREFGLVEDERGIIKGRSSAMLKCLLDARKAAATGKDNVLLLGETGTGKELIAHYVHDMSPKRGGPWRVVSLHTIPEKLIENELFGSEKGAFTDSKSTKRGEVELAAGGTLFIDEFHGIPYEVQRKLLRFLEEETREVQRSGPDAEPQQKIDLQIVLATNDLNIRENIRDDVSRRVSALLEVRVPPLRERLDEIPELAAHLTERAEQILKAVGVEVWQGRTIEADAVEELQKYSWPANVGELRSVMAWVVREYPRLRVVSASQIREALSRGRRSAVEKTEVSKADQA